MLIISPEILEDGTLNNMDFQQGYTDNLLLIPGPMACVPRGRLITGKPRWYNSLWTWDQSLMAVEINTITQGAIQDWMGNQGCKLKSSPTQHSD